MGSPEWSSRAGSKQPSATRTTWCTVKEVVPNPALQSALFRAIGRAASYIGKAECLSGGGRHAMLPHMVTDRPLGPPRACGTRSQTDKRQPVHAQRLYVVRCNTVMTKYLSQQHIGARLGWRHSVLNFIGLHRNQQAQRPKAPRPIWDGEKV